ncbi:MAG: hypothetical protein ACI9BV_003911, partial [Rhodothermales bacterium]
RCGQQARLEVPIAPYAQTYSPGSKDGLDPGCLTAFSERWSIAVSVRPATPRESSDGVRVR